MSTPKGYPTHIKDDRLKAEHSSVESVRERQAALSVLAHQFVYQVGTDAAEASSTTYVINATAHAALKGDVIYFTSGVHSLKEVKVHEVTANTITLAETLAAAVGTGDTFAILRHRYPRTDVDGVLQTSASVSSAPVQYVLDGVDTEVEEDTAVAANNRPLPVKLFDGPDALAISAAGEASVQVTQPLPAGANNIGDVDIASALPAGTNNIGDVDVLTEPATAADGGVLPATTKVISGYDGANVQVIKTDAAGELQIDVLSSALPTGAATLAEQQTQTTSLQLIDDAVATTGAAITAKGIAAAGTDGTNARILKTDASGELQVDVLTLPAITLSQGTSSVAVGDGTDIIAVSAAGEVSTVVTQPLPAGNNNIGDVDVVSVVPGTGATNLGKAEDAAHSSGDTGVMALGVRNDAGTAFAADGDYVPLSVDALGRVRVVSVDAGLDVVDFLDTPLLDASSTNIPASASSPTQFVASLAAAVKKIKVNDTTGKFIGVYTGAALSEVLQAIIGPGEDGFIDVQMAAGDRVSLRNMENSAINVGMLSINFIG